VVMGIKTLLERVHQEVSKMGDAAIAQMDDILRGSLQAVHASTQQSVSSSNLSVEHSRVLMDSSKPHRLSRVRLSGSNGSQPKRRKLRQLTALNPAENYEISEPDENDPNEKPKRTGKVPTWCNDWVDQVSAQRHIDPDSIFGRAPMCDLIAIFGDNSRTNRFQRARRGSSGNWSNDKLAEREIAAYKNAVGQTERASGIYVN